MEWREKHLEDKLTTMLRHKAKTTEIEYRTDDLVQLQEVVSVLTHRKLRGTANCHHGVHWNVAAVVTSTTQKVRKRASGKPLRNGHLVMCCHNWW